MEMKSDVVQDSLTATSCESLSNTRKLEELARCNLVDLERARELALQLSQVNLQNIPKDLVVTDERDLRKMGMLYSSDYDRQTSTGRFIDHAGVKHDEMAILFVSRGTGKSVANLPTAPESWHLVAFDEVGTIVKKPKLKHYQKEKPWAKRTKGRS